VSDAQKGWFADLSDADERDPNFPWQPFVQISDGCLSLDVRFGSKEECTRFIQDEVLAHGIYEEDA
jgi:hypothetical protein